jgi:hypothetical protein
MRRLFHAALVAVLLFAASTLAANDGGKAEFTDSKNHVKTTVGDGLKFESDFYRFEFGGKTSLAANGTVKNTSDKKLYGALYIAFFDKDKNLVASSGRTEITLAAGKQLVVANVLDMPPTQLEKIASYQITIYENEKELGKK